MSNYGDHLFELNIQASFFAYNYTFTYIKVQDVIANIGGFMDLIMVFLVFML